MKAALYEALQVAFFLIAMFFFGLGDIMRRLHPSTISQQIMAGPYYWCVVRKRRARGDEEWQENDLSLGIRPPDGHPYWDDHPITRMGPNPLAAKVTKK